jgi:hypothetical protein
VNTLLLPCECGGQVTVNEAMAGASVKCTCGRMVAIPSLRELRTYRSSAVLPPSGNGANAKPTPVQSSPDAETAKLSVVGNVVGFASVLVWAIVIVPWISRFIFAGADGWNWKQTLLAALGAPFFYGFGKSVGDTMTKQKQKEQNLSPSDNESLPPNDDFTPGKPKEPGA